MMIGNRKQEGRVGTVFTHYYKSATPSENRLTAIRTCKKPKSVLGFELGCPDKMPLVPPTLSTNSKQKKVFASFKNALEYSFLTVIYAKGCAVAQWSKALLVKEQMNKNQKIPGSPSPPPSSLGKIFKMLFIPPVNGNMIGLIDSLIAYPGLPPIFRDKPRSRHSLESQYQIVNRCSKGLCNE